MTRMTEGPGCIQDVADIMLGVVRSRQGRTGSARLIERSDASQLEPIDVI